MDKFKRNIYIGAYITCKRKMKKVDEFEGVTCARGHVFSKEELYPLLDHAWKYRKYCPKCGYYISGDWQKIKEIPAKIPDEMQEEIDLSEKYFNSQLFLLGTMEGVYIIPIYNDVEIGIYVDKFYDDYGSVRENPLPDDPVKTFKEKYKDDITVLKKYYREVMVKEGMIYWAERE